MKYRPRNFRRLLGTALVWAIPLVAAATAAPADTNLLLITIDTLRPDRLSCYSPIYCDTPRIDSLAAQGALFERAFAHDPMTLPSHANILLGLTSLVHGVNENGLSVVSREFRPWPKRSRPRATPRGRLLARFPWIPGSASIGDSISMTTIIRRKPGPGLDYAERKAEKTIAAALGWLSLQKEKWFCWVHLWDPHFPIRRPNPMPTIFARDPYSGEVAYVDAALGKLLIRRQTKGGGTRRSSSSRRSRRIPGRARRADAQLFRLQFDDLGPAHHQRPGR